MQLICSAAVAAILAVSSPTPCAAEGAGPPTVASAGPIQLASTVGFGLPRVPKVPKVPKVPSVPQPKWP